jgi:hypothetical protein
VDKQQSTQSPLGNHNNLLHICGWLLRSKGNGGVLTIAVLPAKTTILVVVVALYLWQS